MHLLQSGNNQLTCVINNQLKQKAL